MGEWHRDVETALETPLVDEYLRQTSNRYGIYLVVWFESDRWATDDGRRADCGRRNSEQTMHELAKRAVELEDQHGLYLRVVPLAVRLP